VKRRIRILIAALVATATIGAASNAAAQDAAVAGVWILNQKLSAAAPNDPTEQPRIDPPSVGTPRRGFPGTGSFGGSEGPPLPRRSNEKERRKIAAVRRRLAEAPARFSIVVGDRQITIVDGYGRVTNLRADGRRQERVTGDGEFTSQTQFDGNRLTVVEDFDGPKVTTTYEPVPAADGRRLHVTIRVEGLPRSVRERNPDAWPDRLVRVYDAAVGTPRADLGLRKQSRRSNPDRVGQLLTRLNRGLTNDRSARHNHPMPA
jgi:hypothetical protein